MRLYIIRHGETDWNKERRLQGQVDIPLNEFGRKLALKTADALREIKFDAAFTSPLKRAKETAEIMIGKRNVPLYEEPLIIEMGFGTYEGLRCKGEDNEINDPKFHYFFDAPHKYQAPSGGESFETVTERVGRFLESLYQNERYLESNILIATHGAALCGMLLTMKQNSTEHFWEGGVHRNCAVTTVDVRNEIPVIEEVGKVYYDDVVSVW